MVRRDCSLRGLRVRRWHHGASQGPGMCHWQLSDDPSINGTCELDLSVVDNTEQASMLS